MLANIRGRLEYEWSRRHYKLWGLPFMPVVPYPLRAARISLVLNPFGCWWLPTFTKLDLTERAKAEGETIWWARWLFFQISYCRFL